MPLNEGPSDVTGCKFSSQESACARNSAKSKIERLADELNQHRGVPILQAGLDGLNISYTTFKYFFDALNTDATTSSSDTMHSWMLTPVGLAVAALESVFLIAFSMLANYHTQQPVQNLFNKYLIQSWPYFRDSLKGLKNSYKGISSLLMASSFLGALSVQDLNLMLVPVAVALGGVTILNRIWYRRMKNQRKEKQEENARLLKEILARKTLTEQEAAEFDRRKKKAQEKTECGKAFGSAVLAGFTDGLYLYIGVYTLASITGPLFIAICVLSAVYVLTSIVTRIYEEYDYQNKLKTSQLKVELALSMQLLKTQLQELDGLLATSSWSVEEDQLRANIVKNWEQFTTSRQKLEKLSTIFNTAALLGGLKNGLNAYGVLASLLFAVGAVLLLASVAFPPAFLMTAIFIGVAYLIGFSIHSLVASYYYRREQRELCRSADELLKQSKVKVDYLQVASVNPEVRRKERELVQLVHKTVEDKDKKLVVKPSPHYIFEEWVGKWLEVFRSFFTGVKQSTKSEYFTIGTFCQEVIVTIIVTAALGIVSAISGALRAIAKNFGRKDNDVSDHSALVPPPLSALDLSSTPPSSPEPVQSTEALVPEGFTPPPLAVPAYPNAATPEVPRPASPRVVSSTPQVSVSKSSLFKVVRTIPAGSITQDLIPDRYTF
ncbi:MAG: hypothetical protein A3F46_06100 [Legionellales bacterium RIFCSPHIGHO2_12_FULL_42_9]|nr:MAG: hypothetical protein A3F46_06100 [Legionellales bacterium RIFCSPHIGHO2_12_FULL_42_9]